MIPLLPPLRLTGATLLRDGLLQRRSISIAGGRIVRGPLPEVDLSGHLLLPGIVDLHGRPDPGLAPQDRVHLHDAAATAAGVTTQLLSQDWGGNDTPATALDVLQARAAQRMTLRCDLRLSLNADVRLTDAGADLIEAVRRHRVGLVTFADPRGGALAHWATGDRAVPRHLCTLAEAFDEMGTLYGSLRDPDGETRERYSMIGARIALFPADRRAAAAAHAMMCPVILSAREVLAGGSGADLVAQGLVDALASDGAPADLARTALALAASATLPFARAWGLISSRPAELLRLADRGTLNPGARADMTILDAATHAPSGTIVRGRLVYATPALADRFAGTAGGMAHAAE